MKHNIDNIEANQLAERGFTVDASFTFATANKGPFTYVVNYTGLQLPWRFTMKGPKVFKHYVKTWDFSHFWKLLNHVEKFSTL